jgi:hypothetical protein
MGTKDMSAVKIQALIYQIRGKSVMLDSDLAELYQVETFRLNEAVKRNIKRFPDDFMFQLTEQEFGSLRSQIAISKPGRGGRRYMPFVFTEQGVAMLSSVLNSERAIQVNINIMRAFVEMRRLALSFVNVRRKIDAMESKYDGQFKVVFDALRRLLTPEPRIKRTIGFIKNER